MANSEWKLKELREVKRKDKALTLVHGCQQKIQFKIQVNVRGTKIWHLVDFYLGSVLTDNGKCGTEF